MKEILTFRTTKREDVESIRRRAERQLHLSLGKRARVEIQKLSLDARDKNAIRWQYRVLVTDEKVEEPALPRLSAPTEPIVVVGGGPCGLFCALRLAECGLNPLLLERGACVEERAAVVKTFCNGGVLDVDTNVQFGEGGAGTFSDGKLNTQTNSPLNREVLNVFVKAGAPEEIAYLSKPHIGSDNLPKVVKNIRNRIIALGGEVRFRSRVDDILFQNGKAVGVVVNGDVIRASAVVLAMGHSARDTFRMLGEKGLVIEPKGFAVGVRIEHPQAQIDRAQYGVCGVYPPADYKLTAKSRDGRGVFTFCMCPGGTVMAAASEDGGVVVNGMSDYARDGVNANAALVAEVRKEEFGGNPYRAMDFQRGLERAAYTAAGGDFRAPTQLSSDFIKGVKSTAFGDVAPTYPRGTNFAPLHEILPDFITNSIRDGITTFGRYIRGYDRVDAVLTGVETRTSSPMRVVRKDNFTAVTCDNLYPAGEGCGYAGGIMSAAADGLRVANAIVCAVQNK